MHLESWRVPLLSSCQKAISFNFVKCEFRSEFFDLRSLSDEFWLDVVWRCALFISSAAEPDVAIAIRMSAQSSSAETIFSSCAREPALSAPLIVTGMHRSGTSMVAAQVASAGVDLHNDKVGPVRSNPHGYFEDADFLALNREILLRGAAPDDGGHPDWGWTEGESFDMAAAELSRDRARQLIANRQSDSADRRWGWKDPRASLLLPFWDDLLPSARFVLVYRSPWDVADSMQRLGEDIFLRRPDYAWRIWRYYNERILKFHQAHRDRTLLVGAEAVWHQPDRFLTLLDQRFGLKQDGAAPKGGTLIDPDLLQRHEGGDPLVALASAMNPEASKLLCELDQAADMPPVRSTETSGQPRRRKGEPAAQITVIIPCYNQGDYLAEAVASVHRSTPEPFDIIVVNDGSTEPRTLQALQVLEGRGYHIIHQENGGLSVARNRGIAAARSRYILPLDADNRLRPGFVPAAVSLLDSHLDIGVVYSDRQDFGLRNGWADVPAFDPDLLLVSNYIDACAVFRKEVWEAVGGYDEQASAWGDWDFWLGALERGWKFKHLEHTGFDYRLRPDSMLARESDSESRLPACEYVAKKHHALYHGRLPNVLVAAQRFATDLFLLARKHEALHLSYSEERAEWETQLAAANDGLTVEDTDSGPSARPEAPDLSFHVPELLVPKKVAFDKDRLDGLLDRAQKFGQHTFRQLVAPFRRQRSVNRALIEAAQLQAKATASLVNRVNHLILSIEAHGNLFRAMAVGAEPVHPYLSNLEDMIASVIRSDRIQLASIQEQVANVHHLREEIDGLESKLRTLSRHEAPSSEELEKIHIRLDRLQTQANWIGKNINRLSVLQEPGTEDDKRVAG